LQAWKEDLLGIELVRISWCTNLEIAIERTRIAYKLCPLWRVIEALLSKSGVKSVERRLATTIAVRADISFQTICPSFYQPSDRERWRNNNRTSDH
jgi:hypothetical protein